MAYQQLNPHQQLRLHMLIVMRTIGVIRDAQSLEGKPPDAVVQFYRRLPDDVRGVIAHEEPIYLAGEILGLSTRDVDRLPNEVWLRCQDIYDKTSMEALLPDGLRQVSDPGPIGPGQPHKLEPLPLGPAPSFP